MLNLNNYSKLDPLKRGQLFLDFKNKNQISYQKIAKKIKKSPAYVVNSVRLLDLPVAIKDGLLGNLISEGHARALASIGDNRETVEIYKNILKTHASVREAEEMVREKRKKNKKIAQKTVREIKDRLEKSLNEKFEKIKLERTSRRIQINCYLDRSHS